MSSTPHVDVDVAIDLRLVVPDSDAVSLPVSLRYSARDPYAVTVAFRGEDVSVEWVFGRDLLIEGMTGPGGQGDVHIWPGQRAGSDLLLISLSSPDGQAVLEADRSDVADFLARTTRIVPPGQEAHFVDLDAEIASLLS
ncbi:SsgA family sporulation/cell division regulator [Thalassiella azotivora]